MTTSPDLALAADFPAASHQQWRVLVDKVLKGADFDRKLVAHTYDGIAIQPLYSAEDVTPGRIEQYPGQAHRARGTAAAGPVDGAWEIRQTQAHPLPATANRELLEDLDGGVSSLALRLDIGGAADVDGVVVGGAGDFAVLLDGVYLDLVSVVLDAGTWFAEAAELMIERWNAAGVAPDERRGNLGADPIGALAAIGRLPGGVEGALAATGELSARTQAWPHVRAVHVDTAPYVDAGASEGEELAAMLATGVAYLRALTDAGLDVGAAAAQIGFTVAADADVFATIAKLRAARRLWSHVVEAAGAAEVADAPFAVRTATRMMSARDPWVNMLRTTAACFAAGAAGATSVTVQPFDAAIGLPDELARRIARNTQLVLQEESHIGAVIDPAGGSYYLETLTDAFTERGWQRFQEIEAGGGIVEALTSGSLAAALHEVRRARMSNIARRRDPLTGVSEFPNLAEDPLARESLDLDSLRRAAAEEWATSPLHRDFAVVSEIEPLPAVRLGSEFEALRDASDALLSATGSRPRVFLANLGPVAVHTARATFAKNLFEAGGIETIGNDGFSSDAPLADAFAASGARLAVICSSDGVYAESGPIAAAALKAAGARRVYVAGQPGDLAEAWREAGVDEFVHVGVDVLAVLRTAHEIEEVAR